MFLQACLKPHHVWKNMNVSLTESAFVHVSVYFYGYLITTRKSDAHKEQED